MRGMIVMLAAAWLIGACAPPAPQSNGSAAPPPHFEDAAARAAYEACANTASVNGAPADKVVSYCGCLVERVHTLSPEQTRPGAPAMAAADADCRK